MSITFLQQNQALNEKINNYGAQSCANLRPLTVQSCGCLQQIGYIKGVVHHGKYGIFVLLSLVLTNHFIACVAVFLVSISSYRAVCLVLTNMANRHGSTFFLHDPPFVHGDLAPSATVQELSV